jgi:hypothetical protein
MCAPFTPPTTRRFITVCTEVVMQLEQREEFEHFCIDELLLGETGGGFVTVV